MLGLRLSYEVVVMMGLALLRSRSNFGDRHGGRTEGVMAEQGRAGRGGAT